MYQWFLWLLRSCEGLCGGNAELFVEKTPHAHVSAKCGGTWEHCTTYPGKEMHRHSIPCRWISHFRKKSLSERRCTGSVATSGPNWPELVRIWFFLENWSKKCLNWCPKVWFLPKLAYLTTHPELDYWTFIHGMSAWQAQGSPDVKLFAKRVWLYLMVRFWSDFLGKWGLILVQIWIDRVWFQKWEHCTVVVRD